MKTLALTFPHVRLESKDVVHGGRKYQYNSNASSNVIKFLIINTGLDY